nr:hypothetical protein [Tanacetum cinerariifolium]
MACPPEVSVISNLEPCHNQNVDELPQTLTSFHSTCYSGDENSFAHDSTLNFVNDSPNVFNPPTQPPMYSYEFCENDAHYSHDCPPQVLFIYNLNHVTIETLISHKSFKISKNNILVMKAVGARMKISNDYTIAITPEEPDNSLSIGDKHLDIIPVTESDEVIKSSVEDLVPIPSESISIPDNTCDEPFRDNSVPLDVSKYQFEEFSDSTSIDDDYFSIDNIDYVEASPPDSKLVSLEEVEDDNLHEKLLNINIFIAKIKSLNDNSTHDRVLKSPSPFPIPVEDSDSFLEKSDTSLSYSDNSLPEFETFSDHTEEKNSGSTHELAEYINTPSWNHPVFYNYDDNDDEDYTIAITPVLPTKEPDNSLIMEDEHLDTILATKLDEVIKSSVKDLAPIPKQFKNLSDSNDDSTSINDDSFSIDDINYVEASPPHSELISLEEMKDFHPEDGELEDDVLREKLSKINHLIAKIEAINANPTPSSDFVLKSPSLFPNSFLEETDTSDNSLLESEIFCFDIEEKNSGSTTIHADISLLDFDHFHFKIEPDSGEFTSIVDSEIRENVLSATNLDLSPEDDQSPLFAYV